MWYNHLPPNSKHDFQEFGTKFMAHFMGERKYSKPSTRIFTIKQKGGKSLKIYYHRFNQESVLISELNDGITVDTFLEWVNYPYYLMTLAWEAPRTMSYLREKLDKQIRTE